MPRRVPYVDRCPVAAALDLLGDRWTLLIVRDLVLGPRRFSALERNLVGIAPDVLSARLRLLATNGVIDRSAAGYTLTATGRQLQPVLRALADVGLLVPGERSSGTLSARSTLTALVLVGQIRDGWSGRVRFEIDGEVAEIEVDGNGGLARAAQLSGETAGVVVGTVDALHALTSDGVLAAGLHIEPASLGVALARALRAPSEPVSL